jgi:hypothetical protein
MEKTYYGAEVGEQVGVRELAAAVQGGLKAIFADAEISAEPHMAQGYEDGADDGGSDYTRPGMRVTATHDDYGIEVLMHAETDDMRTHLYKTIVGGDESRLSPLLEGGVLEDEVADYLDTEVEQAADPVSFDS